MYATKTAKLIGVGLALLALTLLLLVLGAFVALFPAGLTARVVVLVTGIVALAVFAATPAAVYSGWESRVGFAFLLWATGLLILWPRFLFFRLGPGPNVNLLTLSLFGLLMYSIGALIRRRELRHEFRVSVSQARMFLILFVAFYAWRIFAIAFGKYPVAAWIDLAREVMLIAAILVAALAFLKNDDRRRKVINVILASGALVMLAGFVELRLQHNLFRDLVNIDTASADAVQLARSLSEKVRGGSYRVQATFNHPIAMGQFFAMIFFLAAYVAIAASARLRVFGLLMLPGIALMVLKSGSRSGLVALAFGAAIFGTLAILRAFVRARDVSLVRVWWVFALVPLLALGALGALGVFDEAYDYIMSMDRRSASAREAFLIAAEPWILESPFVGYGHGMAAYKAGLIGSDGFLTIDNYYLTLALDYGVPAVLFFVLFHFWAMLRGLMALKHAGANGTLAVALTVAIAIFLLIQSIVSMTSNQMLTVLFCVMLCQLAPGRPLERRATFRSGGVAAANA